MYSRFFFFFCRLRSVRALVLSCVGGGRLTFFLEEDEEEGFDTRDFEARVEDVGFLAEDLLEGFEDFEAEPLVGAMTAGDY